MCEMRNRINKKLIEQNQEKSKKKEKETLKKE